MNLNLEKPIVFFDLETTGLDVTKDRIVEISLLRIEPNNNEQIYTYLVNPTIPIPEKATKIHHITNEMVKDKPTFNELANKIYNIFEGADIAGFNLLKFDIPILVEEFLRCNIDFKIKERNIVDVQAIFHKMEQRNLSAAYKFYCHKDLINAHSSKNDTIATYEIFKAQLEKYEELPKSINEISKLFNNYSKYVDVHGFIVLNEENKEVFNFGKYKGLPIEEIFKKDTGYYGWLINAQFPEHTKKVINTIYERTKKK